MLQRSPNLTTEKPLRFLFPEFFDGRTKAHGFFESFSGKVKRRFSAEIDGGWENGRFQLAEQFRFCDGSSEERVWILSPLNDGTYSASCEDIASPTQIIHKANTATMSYRIAMSVANRSVVLHFSDLFVMVSPTEVLSRAHISKWGLPVGRIVASFSN